MPREIPRAEIVKALWFPNALIKLRLPQGCEVDIDHHGDEFITVKFFMKETTVASLAILRWPLYGEVPFDVLIDHNLVLGSPTPIKVNGTLLGEFDRAKLTSGDCIAVVLVKGSDDKYEVLVTAASLKIAKRYPHQNRISVNR